MCIRPPIISFGISSFEYSITNGPWRHYLRTFILYTIPRAAACTTCHAFRPPCKYPTYGSRRGPSKLSSIVDPCTKVPPAIRTSVSYPCMELGSGTASASSAEHSCTARANAANRSRDPHSMRSTMSPVSYTHLRAHETRHDLVCRLLLEKKKN